MSRRITELRHNLLPSRFDPLGLYSDRVYERTRAFRVLAHAEFESFIEDRALEVLLKAHSEWKLTGKIRPSLLALMSHWEVNPKIPENLSDLDDKSKKYPTLSARIESAKGHYSTYLKMQNNGIKAKNLLLILLPLGVTKAEINATWLNDTESWATDRGTVAHTSAKMQVQLDPKIELATVRKVRDGFRDIDKILHKK
ncbi:MULTISPECIES: HEPN domain-containing protein [unclassified Streptomyces]|uniref:HEPN domain-containing protein n=1 Tax=unclassified Streptomyces TaxID=2593676 RepID=UPI0036E2E38C